MVFKIADYKKLEEKLDQVLQNQEELKDGQKELKDGQSKLIKGQEEQKALLEETILQVKNVIRKLEEAVRYMKRNRSVIVKTVGVALLCGFVTALANLVVTPFLPVFMLYFLPSAKASFFLGGIGYLFVQFKDEINKKIALARKLINIYETLKGYFPKKCVIL